MEVIFFLALGFLLIRLCVVSFNLADWPFLSSAGKTKELDVSVLIPARNEEQRISILLNSLIKSSYNKLEILVYDDQSTDRTSEIVHNFSKSNPNIRLITGTELPEGWLGKPYACHRLAEEASGEMLIYLDADTVIGQGFFMDCVDYFKKHEPALFSVFNTQITRSAGEFLVVPLMHYLLLTLLPLKSVRSGSNPAFSAASGQCMVFSAIIYRKEQWHRKVRDKVTEDIEIMREVKKSSYMGAALLSAGQISCRMYSSYFEGFNGFTKNLVAGFGGSILGMSVYLFLVVLCWPFLFFSLPPAYMWTVLLLMIAERIGVSVLAKQNIFINLLFHPFQMLTLAGIGAFSAWKKLTGTNKWKGRNI